MMFKKWIFNYIRTHTDIGRKIKEICPYEYAKPGNGCVMDKPYLQGLRKDCPELCEKWRTE